MVTDDINTEASSGLDVSTASAKGVLTGKWKCRQCDKITTLQQKRGHLATHELNPRLNRISGSYYQCALCGEKYLLKRDAEQHLRHHDNPTLEYVFEIDNWRCPVCKKVHKDANAGIIHSYEHAVVESHIVCMATPKPWSCQICTAEFSTRWQAVLHINRTHLQHIDREEY